MFVNIDFTNSHFTECDPTRYGNQCTGICTCIAGATCNHVDGICECDESSDGFVCDKGMLHNYISFSM